MTGYLLPHRPATAIADRMAPEAGDPFAVALWRAHLERALRAAHALKAGTPVPQVAARDPYALRGLIAVLVVATFFAAGGERTKRIAAAFDWRGVVTPANFRIDAWVTPPAYTGRPPLILPGLQPGEQSVARAGAPVTVPAGSTLVVRSTGQSDSMSPSKAHRRGQVRSEAPGAQGHRGAAFHHHRGRHRHRQGRRGDVVWTFNAIRIARQTIALAKEPEPQLRGSRAAQLQARGRLRRGRRPGDVRAQAAASDKPAPAEAKPPRPLFEPPISPWCCRSATRAGAGTTTKDLSEHPGWRAT